MFSWHNGFIKHNQKIINDLVSHMATRKGSSKAIKNHKKPRRKKRSRSALLLILLIVVLAAGVTFYWFQKAKTSTVNDPPADVVLNQNLSHDPPKNGNLKEFTGSEFRDLYNSYAYPNTEYISDDAVITGELATDTHIREMAEKRGYVRRSAPVQNTFREVEPNMLLQERASEPWQQMKERAKTDGLNIYLTAAYRSAKEQRSIFIERISAIGLTESLIQSGLYNSELDGILATTAIPGYSRHHTGYTVDIGCGNEPAIAFELSVCFDWLSANNYKNAKTYGWIPSYPEGAGQQGPEPETWEYVWVGIDALTE